MIVLIFLTPPPFFSPRNDIKVAYSKENTLETVWSIIKVDMKVKKVFSDVFKTRYRVISVPINIERLKKLMDFLEKEPLITGGKR